MSFKAYLMRIENPSQAKILQDYLTEMDGIGWFNYALRVNEKTPDVYQHLGLEKNDVVAAITVDRGDLLESFVEETNVCDWGEVPFYTSLEALTVDILDESIEDGKIEWMTIDPEINLANLSSAVARGTI